MVQSQNYRIAYMLERLTRDLFCIDQDNPSDVHIREVINGEGFGLCPEESESQSHP